MDISNTSSDFLTETSLKVSHKFTELTELSSPGFNRLIKAKRYGKWMLLKTLKKEYAQQTIYRQLLRKEFDVAVTLSHPNIVQIIGWEDVEGIGECIILEYIDGLTLKEYLTQEHTQKEKQKIANELIAAVEYINSRQIVHRDLKPSNLMVTTNGNNLKLIDFGLSDTDSYQILKQPAGTEKYMSPEQKQTSVPDCRNDIYSVGKILLELNAGSVYNIIARRCTDDIKQRYKSLKDAENDLQKLYKHRQIALYSFFVTAITTLSILLFLQFEYNKNLLLTANQQKDTIYITQKADTVYIQPSTTTKYDSIRSYKIEDNNKVNQTLMKGKAMVNKLAQSYINFADTVSPIWLFTKYKPTTERFDSLSKICKDLSQGYDQATQTIITNTLQRYYYDITKKSIDKITEKTLSGAKQCEQMMKASNNVDK